MAGRRKFTREFKVETLRTAPDAILARAHGGHTRDRRHHGEVLPRTYRGSAESDGR